MAEVTHLDRAGTPGALAILDDLVAGHEHPPVGYEATVDGAWVRLGPCSSSPPILSSGEISRGAHRQRLRPRRTDRRAPDQQQVSLC